VQENNLSQCAVV